MFFCVVNWIFKEYFNLLKGSFNFESKLVWEIILWLIIILKIFLKRVGFFIFKMLLSGLIFFYLF